MNVDLSKIKNRMYPQQQPPAFKYEWKMIWKDCIRDGCVNHFDDKWLNHVAFDIYFGCYVCTTEFKKAYDGSISRFRRGIERFEPTQPTTDNRRDK